MAAYSPTALALTVTAHKHNNMIALQPGASRVQHMQRLRLLARRKPTADIAMSGRGNHTRNLVMRS
jgi:hypothetical protein